MKLKELIKKLDNIWGETQNSEALVMIMNAENNELSDIKSIEYEYHEDTNSNTVWIKVEDN